MLTRAALSDGRTPSASPNPPIRMAASCEIEMNPGQRSPWWADLAPTTVRCTYSSAAAIRSVINRAYSAGMRIPNARTRDNIVSSVHP